MEAVIHRLKREYATNRRLPQQIMSNCLIIFVGRHFE
jgi:hypothetical protein